MIYNWAVNKGAAVRIIESHHSYIGLPREKMEIQTDINLPDNISCEIGLGTNEDPDAPYLAVKLTFYVNDEAGRKYTVVFQEKPPLKLLEQIAVDGITIFEIVSNPETNDPMRKLLDLAANLAYTPLAKVRIYQQEQIWLDIWLSIGEWEGNYEVPFVEFKEELKL